MSITSPDSPLQSLSSTEQSEPFLEKLLQKMASLEKFQRSLRESINLNEALRTGLMEITRLIGFSVGGFYMISEEGTFDLLVAEPSERTKMLEDVVASEIERGTFAWALRQSRPIIQRNDETKFRVLFCALTSPARIMGMFVGLIEDEGVRAAEDVQGLLSLMLLGITYTLENYQLVNELRAYNDDLQEVVRKRTAEIVRANAETVKLNSELKLELEVGLLREKELKVAKSIAEEAGRAKGEFLAVMSHEIRTPMSGVIGFASLLETTGLTEEQLELVQQIHLSGEQLLNLLNDLLDFSKIEAGGLQLESHPINVREMAWGLVRFISTRAAEKGVEVGFDVDEDVPETVSGDSTRLRQVVTNLLGNALKFTAKGEILLTISCVPREDGTSGKQLLWTVRDTGIGIPPDKIGRLFKPFSQADSSTSRKYGGTGLGLAICLKLCQMMGGRIWVESETGQGSQFKFTFPLPFDSSPESTHTGFSPLSGIGVYLVSEHIHQKQILSKQFARWGMKVWGSSSDLESALKFRDRSPVDILVIDAQSIRTDATEVLRTIRKTGPSQACLLFTQARAEREKIEESHDPLSVCLLKPVPPAVIQSALVRLFLPGSDSDPVKIVANESSRSGLKRSKQALTVLLVDDNPMNLTIGNQLLKTMGHEVKVACNGHEAITVLRGQAFDLVIMDVNMGDLDGIQTTRMIRSGEAGLEKSQIFITAWTALATNENRATCLEAGMNDFLTKPLNPAELQKIIDACAKRKSTASAT